MGHRLEWHALIDEVMGAMRRDFCSRDRGGAVRTRFGGVLLRLALLVALLSVTAFPAASQTVFDDQYADQEEPAPRLAILPAKIVPMPRVTIYPNDTITDEMLADRELADDNQKHAVFMSREGLVGKVSKQTLLPNAPIAVNAMREPFAIKLGHPAVVIFKSGGLVISGTAVPLQTGFVGETIALRNAESNTTIRGVVQPDGTVRVGP